MRENLTVSGWLREVCAFHQSVARLRASFIIKSRNDQSAFTSEEWLPWPFCSHPLNRESRLPFVEALPPLPLVTPGWSAAVDDNCLSQLEMYRFSGFKLSMYLKVQSKTRSAIWDKGYGSYSTYFIYVCVWTSRLVRGGAIKIGSTGFTCTPWPVRKKVMN